MGNAATHLPNQPRASSFSGCFHALAGNWLLGKTISDGSRFDGRAIFEPCELHRLTLREAGQLVLADGTRLAASQSWTWTLCTDGGLEIRYPDEKGGGIYHQIVLQGRAGSWHGSASHSCGRDRYKASYAIKPGIVCIRHEIDGPNKACSIAATYRKTR